ncbi:MAG TPA: hypothetical protein VHL60_07575 [Oxalicibacterium sp.]|jgi:hypothetical protein|nr:hypothetical protein [Oxalicibacterium sp.]
MSKYPVILAGGLLALTGHFALAQSTTGATTTTTTTATTPSDPAYTDQSRANQSNDPYIKKRVTVKEAKKQYKADKAEAKDEYKEKKSDAKEDYKATKRDARETRKEELKETGR